MPRRPRIQLNGVPLHIVQRGHNREPCFFGEEDYTSYLHWLSEALGDSECQLHACALMTNHVHLLLTPGKPQRYPGSSCPWGGATCNTSTAHTNVPALYGTAATSRPSSTPTPIYSPASATSNSTRYARRWSMTLHIIAGRAIGTMRWARRVRFKLMWKCGLFCFPLWKRGWSRGFERHAARLRNGSPMQWAARPARIEGRAKRGGIRSSHTWACAYFLAS